MWSATPSPVMSAVNSCHSSPVQLSMTVSLATTVKRLASFGQPEGARYAFGGTASDGTYSHQLGEMQCVYDAHPRSAGLPRASGSGPQGADGGPGDSGGRVPIKR
jgi:hypothetical protein